MSPLIERFNASEPGQSRHSDWLDLSQGATVAEERGQGGAFRRVHIFATEAKQGDVLENSHFACPMSQLIVGVTRPDPPWS